MESETDIRNDIRFILRKINIRENNITYYGIYSKESVSHEPRHEQKTK